MCSRGQPQRYHAASIQINRCAYVRHRTPSPGRAVVSYSKHMFKRFVESSGFRLTPSRLETVTLKSPTV